LSGGTHVDPTRFGLSVVADHGDSFQRISREVAIIDYGIWSETRRSAYALKRQGKTTTQVAEALGLTADQLVLLLGPVKEARIVHRPRLYLEPEAPLPNVDEVLPGVLAPHERGHSDHPRLKQDKYTSDAAP
jgi:hypothetical protein